jgi:hypothetical protein
VVIQILLRDPRALAARRVGLRPLRLSGEDAQEGPCRAQPDQASTEELGPAAVGHFRNGNASWLGTAGTGVGGGPAGRRPGLTGGRTLKVLAMGLVLTELPAMAEVISSTATK